MAVQRKIFRIEQTTGAVARGAPFAAAAMGDTPQRHELMAEIKALRAMIEPHQNVNREMMDRARAQISEAQAYKREIDLIYAAVKRTKQEIDTINAGRAAQAETGRAGRELQAIVKGTEQATQSVLQATEEIDQVATTLSAVLKGSHDQGLVHDIHERVVQIYEACNFQDLTGQRVAKVAATLKFVEDHVTRLMEIWQGIEQFKPVVIETIDDDRKFLHGPKLGDDAGHCSQADVDTMFVK
jgi:chemotaxis protein CheZ